MIIYKGKIRDRFSLKVINSIVMLMLVGAFIVFNGMLSTQNTSGDDVIVSDSSPAETIDMSGEWIGFITEDYDANYRYDYTVTLDQVGNTLTGLGIQDVTDGAIDIYAESSLAGDVDNTTVYFYEVSTDVLENLSLDQWCRIEMTLEYSVVEGQEMLIGSWDSTEDDRAGCAPIDGRVVLTRE